MGNRKRVNQGESVQTLALQNGFTEWREVYFHGENATVRSDRPNPGVLFPGDTLFIPDIAAATEDASTNAKHRFRLLGGYSVLRIQVRDFEKEVCGKRRYELEIAGSTVSGETSADGRIEEKLPGTIGTAKLRIWFGDDTDPPYQWSLLLDHLDPINKVSGVQARLRNLGFDTGAIDGIAGPRTEAATMAFQEEHGLTIDGIAGPKTQRELTHQHGC